MTPVGRRSSCPLVTATVAGRGSATDREKARAIKAAGHELMPFTWAEVVYESKQTAAEILTMLERRAHLAGS